MSSSISSSDDRVDLRWRRWLIVFIAIMGCAMAALFPAVVVLDPYSTGRFTPFQRVDIVSSNGFAANAGRVRNPAFDAAIIGNSHGNRLLPENLSRATGRKFVSLTIAGTYPPAHLFLMKAFERLRRGQQPLLVLVLDGAWCESQPKPDRDRLLPEWVYGGSDFEYLRRLMSEDAVRGAARRLLLLMGHDGATERPDGYIPDVGRINVAEMRRQMETMARPTDAAGPHEPFPYFDQLAQTIDQLAVDTRILMVFPPVHIVALPAPNSRAEARLQACKSRARSIADSRRGIGLVDLYVDGPIARDIDRFSERTHYNEATAREIEPVIAAAARQLYGNGLAASQGN